MLGMEDMMLAIWGGIIKMCSCLNLRERRGTTKQLTM